MNTKLLLVLLLVSFLGSSQTINNFNSTDGSVYAVVSSDSGFDPGAAPTAGVWNFTFTTVTTSSDDYSVPTTGEVSTYPGSTSLQTTTVITGASTSETVKTFTKDDSGELSITGIESSELNLSLNYNTDNALVGTFPFSNTTPSPDDVSGEAIIDGSTTANFTGTVEAYVDNTGTLVMTIDGNETYNNTVTRLSLSQSLSLFIDTGVFTVQVATATQTTYFYYDNTTNDLVFRSTNTIINRLLPSPETTEDTVMESIISSSTLGTPDINLAKNNFVIRPNPVKQNLAFEVDANVQAISIFNIIGKQVLNIKTNNKKLFVNQLKPGLYIVKVDTDRGTISKKFIKE